MEVAQVVGSELYLELRQHIELLSSTDKKKVYYDYFFKYWRQEFLATDDESRRKMCVGAMRKWAQRCCKQRG